MATELSAAAAGVKPSATLSLKAEIARVEATYGVKVIDMTAGQPDIGPTPDVVEALVEGGKLHKYGPVPGETGLRSVIAESVNSETGASFKPEQIILTVGAKGGIDTVMRAVVDPGDRVVVLSPHWVTYPENVGINGGTAVFARSRPDLHPDIDELAAVVRESRPKAIIYSSPSNPTGAVYNSEELSAIVGIAREAGAWLIADEIYRQFAFDGKKAPSVFSVAEPYEQTVLIDGPSKRFGIPGWRLGFITGPAYLTKAIGALLGHTSNPSRPIQHAVEVAYKSEQAAGATAEMVRRYQANRDLFVDGLNRVDGIRCPKPEGAFYCFPDVSGLYGRSYEFDGESYTISHSTDLRNFLLRKAEVAVVEGEPFGMDTHARFSLAITRADCEAALANVAGAVAELSPRHEGQQ